MLRGGIPRGQFAIERRRAALRLLIRARLLSATRIFRAAHQARGVLSIILMIFAIAARERLSGTSAMQSELTAGGSWDSARSIMRDEFAKRMYLYARLDERLACRIRFFAAAALTNGVLARPVYEAHAPG
jgi:hypothetical protein